MKKLKMLKGFKPRLAGLPDFSVIHLPEPETVAVSAMDIPYIRPKLLVRENDIVRIGTPVFKDKRNPSIQYVSPASGRVEKIVFGPRRKLIEVVIALDRIQDNNAVEFKPVLENQIHDIEKAKLIQRLQIGGLWQCFRQFPNKDTADDTFEPPMIIVSLNGNDIFSPHPALLLENDTRYFEYGLEVLKRLTHEIIVSARESSLEKLAFIEDKITHAVPDIFPAWDPGALLYRMKTNIEDNRSWCICAEHLVLIAKFLLTGRYPVKRLVTVTRPSDRRPHIMTRQGVPVKDLVGRMNKTDLITTGRFNGRTVEPGTHLGFFDSTLNIIRASETEEMLGFVRPGFTKPTVSKTFVSSLLPFRVEPDCNAHGEQRACINCGYCAKICPVDLLPSFIMKALHADDIEEALELGMMDCCQCGLCSFTCPSKIELTHILSQGMDAHYKDKE